MRGSLYVLSTSMLPSVEPSFMIRNSKSLYVWERMLSTASFIYFSPLYTGIRTITFGLFRLKTALSPYRRIEYSHLEVTPECKDFIGPCNGPFLFSRFPDFFETVAPVKGFGHNIVTKFQRFGRRFFMIMGMDSDLPTGLQHPFDSQRCHVYVIHMVNGIYGDDGIKEIVFNGNIF